MKTAKTTHIQQFRNDTETNQEYIMRLFGWTMLEYNTHEFDLGMAFLQQLFPDGSDFAQYMTMHSYNKLYWNWFRTEFALAEKQLIDHCIDNNKTLNEKSYLVFFKLRITIPQFVNGFNNYLETFKRYDKSSNPSKRRTESDSR